MGSGKMGYWSIGKIPFEREAVKNPCPEDVALFGAPWKGAKSVPSDPGVVGVMEYWSNGLELREGF